MAILRGSFPSLARAVLPLALLFILSACGGSTPPKAVSTRVVHGPGFSFSVGAGWTVRRTSTKVSASRGDSEVSATVFTLLKPYAPSLFDRAAKELDGVAAKLATRSGGKVTERVTTVVDGRKVRAYRYESGGVAMRIGFVLVGKREYQLACTGDTGAPCDTLFSTFAAT